MAGRAEKENATRRGPLGNRLGSGQLDLSVHRLLSLTAPSGELARLLELAAGPPDRLAGGLASDAPLAARIAGMVRAGSSQGRIPTAAEAVSGVGPDDAFRAAALTIAAEAFGAGTGRLPREDFWTHSAAVGLVAEALARRAGRASWPRAFAAGLLHDLGKIALDACLPKSYARVLDLAAGRRGDLAELERDTLGADHTIVGRRLARQWRLPGAIVEAVWLHHQPPEALPPMFAANPLIGWVQLADAVVRREQIGFSGNFAFGSSIGQLAAEVGVDERTIADAVATLEARLEQLRQLAGRSAAMASVVRPPEPRAPGPPAEAAPADRFAALAREVSAAAAEADDLPQLCVQLARTLRQGLSPRADVLVFAIACDSGEAIVAARTDRGETLRISPCRTDATAPQAPAPAPAPELLVRLLRDAGAWDDLADLPACVCLPLVGQGRWLGGVIAPARSRPDEQLATLLDMAALAAAAGMERHRANQLTEQLVAAGRRLAETRGALAEAETLAVVGEMAAGAAHEINNPLTVISGRAQLLAARADDPDAVKAADLIARKAEEISRIASDLMDFARPPDPTVAPTPLGELLERVKAQAEGWSLPKRPAPTVDIQIRPDGPAANVDAGQIEGVLLELVRNAADATEGQAHVRLEAILPAGTDRVLLAVTDDGPGMDEATVAAAFTPFFSHRPAGRGRGMGLARARRTVQANGGSIRIDSRPGRGTTIFVELPKA